MLLVGVAVAEGGLVATTADPLGGMQRIDMIGAGGKLQAASVVATDKTSDVALVSVPQDLPVATSPTTAGSTAGPPTWPSPSCRRVATRSRSGAPPER